MMWGLIKGEGAGRSKRLASPALGMPPQGTAVPQGAAAQQLALAIRIGRYVPAAALAALGRGPVALGSGHVQQRALALAHLEHALAPANDQVLSGREGKGTPITTTLLARGPPAGRQLAVGALDGQRDLRVVWAVGGVQCGGNVPVKNEQRASLLRLTAD